jgi:hypothetical protein
MAVVTIPDKSPGDSFYASELNQILDAIKDGTIDINTLTVTVNGYITLDDAPADGSCSGITISGTAAEDVAVGELVYLNSDSKFALADADAEATAGGMLAIATGTINADADGIFILRGFIRESGWSFTPGDKLYVSTTEAGLTSTAPSGSGDVKRSIGYAYTSDIVYFDPSNDYVVF